MARQRMVKPDIWIDEGFLSLSIPARLLWIGIISGADDEGRGLATDKCLKARVFPGDEITLEEIRKMRDELAKHVNVLFYEVEGREYYQLTKWKDHQKVEYSKPSTLPKLPFTEDSPKIHRTFTSNELTNKPMNKGKMPPAPIKGAAASPGSNRLPSSRRMTEAEMKEMKATLPWKKSKSRRREDVE